MTMPSMTPQGSENLLTSQVVVVAAAGYKDPDSDDEHGWCCGSFDEIRDR